MPSRKKSVITKEQPKKRGIKAKGEAVAATAPKRTYSDRERGAALALLDFNGGVIDRTAKMLGIPASTLGEWANGRVSDAVKDEADGARKDLRDKCEEAAHQILDQIMERATQGMKERDSLKDWTMSFAIIIDKKQLLNGDPTNINGTVASDRKAEYEALVDRVLKRATDAGEQVTRESIIGMIVERKPEAREYLM
jgi:transposase